MTGILQEFSIPSQRSYNAIFQNLTGEDIWVVLNHRTTSGGQTLTCQIGDSSPPTEGVTMLTCNLGPAGGTASSRCELVCPIPAGYFYRVNMSSTPTTTVSNVIDWWEYQTETMETYATTTCESGSSEPCLLVSPDGFATHNDVLYLALIIIFLLSFLTWGYFWSPFKPKS